MSMIGDIRDRKSEELRAQLVQLKRRMAAAGLSQAATCPGCGGTSVVLSHVVVEPKHRDHLHAYQPMTIADIANPLPVALVCARCGRVAATMVQNPQDFEQGLTVRELEELE